MKKLLSLSISILKSKTKSKSKSKTKSKSISKTKTLKYCCPDIKNKTQCAKLNLELKIDSNNKYTNTNLKPKYAITTLIFGGDSYLPGILLLGSSIRKIMPKAYEKYITLCCMVTHDISKQARSLILKIYDRIIDVEYLQIPPNLIRHNNPQTQKIYAKTFTKLRIFEMTEYDKVLFLDADMLILKKDIFSLFNLNTPATIFMGKLNNNPKDRYFKEFKENGRLFKQFQNKYCNWKEKGKELHGNLIPYDKYENEKTNDGMNIETSVLLITPSILSVKQRDNYLENIKTKHIKIRGDTEMVSKMFKDKIYAIEPRFFGRWVNPEEHSELIVLDLYGSDGKPWDINKLNLFMGWKDVEFWWKFYMSKYKSEYEKWNNKMLDTLYEIIIKFISINTNNLNNPLIEYNKNNIYNIYNKYENKFKDISSIINKNQDNNIYIYWVGNDYKLIKILRTIIYLHSNNGKNYNVHLINKDNIKNYIKNIPDYFYKLLPAHQADYVRVCVICDNGGIWLDSDTLVMDDLNTLFNIIKNKNGFFIKENNKILWNGIFGSKANTPLMLEWKEKMINILNKKENTIEWAEIGCTLLEKIKNSNPEYYSNYKIFNGLDNIYPVNFDKCVNEFIYKSYDNYKNIKKNYQPLIVLVNSVYKELENLDTKDILNINIPLNYFIQKSLLFNKQIK
jgi:alpha-N-acetylglucosamine transferase